MICGSYGRFVIALVLGLSLAAARLNPCLAADNAKPAFGTAAALGPQEKFSVQPLVLTSPSQTATFDAEKGCVTISTQRGQQLKKRATVAFDSVKQFKSYKTVRSADPPRHGIEVYSDSAEPAFTLLLSDDGIFEFKPGKARQLVLRDLRLQYGVVPSLVGTDFVYSAKTQPGADRLHIPSMNVVVGLIEGEDCMAVGVWPPGKQSASFEVKKTDNGGLLDGFAFDTAGQSFYVSFLTRPGIWHVEPLKPTYLEKDTVIAWKRPFEAKWIGRFFITSDEYDWPFYFLHQRTKLWGRYIRGWFNYPVWFDGDKTVIHFEKHFLPKGEVLIYYLESHPLKPERSVGSPVAVMEKTVGKQPTAGLLDFDGAVEKTLLEHRMAVCAMTNTMQKWFDAGEEVQHRDQIERWCDDTSAFIGMIRQRCQEYGELARGLKAGLADRAKTEPKLADMIHEIEPMLATIEDTSKDLPPVSLEKVRQWTDEMKGMAAQVRPDNKQKYGKLAAQCRSVAGAQDDLSRALSILAIRLTEQAAQQGVRSPEHARLAEEVIAKTRQVLRKPTWWEPRRHYEPKSDPGRP